MCDVPDQPSVGARPFRQRYLLSLAVLQHTLLKEIGGIWPLVRVFLLRPTDFPARISLFSFFMQESTAVRRNYVDAMFSVQLPESPP